jgi:hypothetical protein
MEISSGLTSVRDVLGIWFQKTEGAKFWLQVLTQLKTARRRRRPRGLRRRAERLPRGDRGGLPPGVGADVSRALCRLAGYVESRKKVLLRAGSRAIVSA